MTEFPTLFCGDMVRAIQEDRKTKTRRLLTWRNSLVDGCRNKKLFLSLDWSSLDIFVDGGPSPAGNPGPYLHVPHKTDGTTHRVYPQWQKDDRLWVKETFFRLLQFSRKEKKFLPVVSNIKTVRYAADNPFFSYNPGEFGYKKTSSIFMPRWASRINLTVKSIRVERVQEITDEDAKAEGMKNMPYMLPSDKEPPKFGEPICLWRYRELWDIINGKKEGCAWNDNPWVWVIEFNKEK